MLVPSGESLAAYDHFLATASPDRLQKMLARAELFQRSAHLPGDIVECGVFKGSGIYLWSKLSAIFKPLSEQRIVGFDFFEADRSADFRFEDDQTCLDEHSDGWAARQTILANLGAMGIDNVDLVSGNVVDTTPAYAADNLGFRIRLLYLDVDNYEGSLAILKALYPLVVRGGIVAFDEYAYRGYGEADAVDEFFAGHQGVVLQSLPWANTPTAFLVKP